MTKWVSHGQTVGNRCPASGPKQTCKNVQMVKRLEMGNAESNDAAVKNKSMWCIVDAVHADKGNVRGGESRVEGILDNKSSDTERHCAQAAFSRSLTTSSAFADCQQLTSCIRLCVGQCGGRRGLRRRTRACLFGGRIRRGRSEVVTKRVDGCITHTTDG